MIVMITSVATAPAQALEVRVDIRAITEEWAPYNYQAVDGSVQGLSTDLLRELCTQARLTCSFEIMPWARAMRLAQTEPGTLLFTTARTPERETQFRWIGPIAPRGTWVYRLRAPDAPACQPAMAGDSCRYGVVRDDAARNDLHLAGVPDSRIEEATDEGQNLKKLMYGRIQAITGTEIAVRWLAKHDGVNADRLERTAPLSRQTTAYYYALNPRTDPALIARLEDAWRELQARHRPEQIQNAYLEAARRP
jgi:polar amino acid transport system substrate-binding protein